MHPIFTLWSTSEPELSPILLSIAAAIEQTTQAQQHVLVTFTPNMAQVSMYVVDGTCFSRADEREKLIYTTCIYTA